MSDADKVYEDTRNQGGFGGTAPTNTVNHAIDLPRRDVIPGGTTQFGPKNWPVHIYPDQWQAGAEPENSSPTGISMG